MSIHNHAEFSAKGATRSWTYDSRNLTVTKVMPDPDDTCSYTYDALGRIKVKTQQDLTTVELIYDLAGRMTERQYSDSTTDEFHYDAASRLTIATKGRHAITVTRDYDPDGTMRSESYELDGRTYTLEREYDDANRVASQTFADGKVMTWDYDSRHLVTEAHYDGKIVLEQDFDPGYCPRSAHAMQNRIFSSENAYHEMKLSLHRHWLTQQTFGNGLVREITFGRLDNQRTFDRVRKGISTIHELNFAYTYLADKNVETETQANGLFQNLSFTATYDSGNRVTSYNRQASYVGAREAQAWNYDGAGNWNTTVIDGTTQNRTHSPSDQLEIIAGTNLDYDSRGNLLSDERGNSYTWDLDNRIIESEGSGYQDISYRYDALGRRIVREQGSSKEVLLWWGNTEQAGHKHQAGQTTIQNDLQANPSEQALNTIFARALEGSKFDIEYFHKNYLDHVMAVSNDNGNLIEHYRYTAFGEPEIYDITGKKLATTEIDNDILWNVRRYEPVNGLYMYKYRDYDAASGRWLSRDPIEERGGSNLYGYTNNQPLSNFDKHGLYSSEKAATDAAKNILGLAARISRMIGQMQIEMHYAQAGHLNTRDTPLLNTLSTDDALMLRMPDGLPPHWFHGVAGVEFATIVYCDPNREIGDQFHFISPIWRGFLPDEASYNRGNRGNVPLILPPDGTRGLAHLHTHSHAHWHDYGNGLDGFEPFNGPPSEGDLSLYLDLDMTRYLVYERGFSYYLYQY